MKSLLFVVVLSALIASSFAMKCYKDCDGFNGKVDTSGCTKVTCPPDSFCGRKTPKKEGSQDVKTSLTGCFWGTCHHDKQKGSGSGWPLEATCLKVSTGTEICLCKGNLCNEAGATIATTFTVAGTLVSILALYCFS